MVLGLLSAPVPLVVGIVAHKQPFTLIGAMTVLLGIICIARSFYNMARL
jgi:hypothetical protein